MLRGRHTRLGCEYGGTDCKGVSVPFDPLSSFHYRLSSVSCLLLVLVVPKTMFPDLRARDASGFACPSDGHFYLLCSFLHSHPVSFLVSASHSLCVPPKICFLPSIFSLHISDPFLLSHSPRSLLQVRSCAASNPLSPFYFLLPEPCSRVLSVHERTPFYARPRARWMRHDI